MDGIALLDVVIGLAFLFLALSVLASSIQEAVASCTRIRAGILKQAILHLLSDVPPQKFKSLFNITGSYGNDSLIGQAIITHPIFAGMAQPMGRMRKSIVNHLSGDEGPSYLSSAQFVDILMDVLKQQAGSATSTQALVDALPDGLLKSALRTHLVNSADTAQFRTKLEQWYNEFMERVSGWYKRRTQIFLFLIGLGIAYTFKVDTLAFADRLMHDGVLRKALADQGEEQINRLDQTSVPEDADISHEAILALFDDDELRLTEARNIAISAGRQLCETVLPRCESGDTACNDLRDTRSRRFRLWEGEISEEACQLILAAPDLEEPAEQPAAPAKPGWSYYLGLLVTAFAISLGAPYWLSLLRILTSLRGSNPGSTESGRDGGPGTTGGRWVVLGPHAPGGGSAGFEATLSDDDIADIQKVLGMPSDQQSGELDLRTRDAIRKWQLEHEINPTGRMTPYSYQQMKHVDIGLDTAEDN